MFKSNKDHLVILFLCPSLWWLCLGESASDGYVNLRNVTPEQNYDQNNQISLYSVRWLHLPSTVHNLSMVTRRRRMQTKSMTQKSIEFNYYKYAFTKSFHFLIHKYICRYYDVGRYFVHIHIMGVDMVGTHFFIYLYMLNKKICNFVKVVFVMKNSVNIVENSRMNRFMYIPSL